MLRTADAAALAKAWHEKYAKEHADALALQAMNSGYGEPVMNNVDRARSTISSARSRNYGPMLASPGGPVPTGLDSAYSSYNPANELPLGYEEELVPIGYDSMGNSAPSPRPRPPMTPIAPVPVTTGRMGGLPSEPVVDMSQVPPALPAQQGGLPADGGSPISADNPYAAQLKTMMDKYLAAPIDETLSEKDRRNQWLRAGLATMSSASQPGATLFGSVGAGGLAAMDYGDQIKASRAAARRANLEGALDTADLLAKYEDLARDRASNERIEGAKNDTARAGVAVDAYGAETDRAGVAIDAANAQTNRQRANTDQFVAEETAKQNMAENFLTGRELDLDARELRRQTGVDVLNARAEIRKNLDESITNELSGRELEDFIDGEVIKNMGPDSEQARFIGRQRITEQLTALDQAKTAGNITPSQYEAQRAALAQQMQMINDGSYLSVINR